ncbi:hypothetical protein [Cupriavidus pampae]|uniref:Uncharacterized protein n=1 Tax=Cupriavidus pampae TaxID=659251 RepID=A0ABM8XYH1_9BURK|nr:hypothetical protein [Cupriavidus pampae]CAG9185404.1 hypothetical protein LMG32289_05946 [Cupriavidus pampae]
MSPRIYPIAVALAAAAAAFICSTGYAEDPATSPFAADRYDYQLIAPKPAPSTKSPTRKSAHDAKAAPCTAAHGCLPSR